MLATTLARVAPTALAPVMCAIANRGFTSTRLAYGLSASGAADNHATTEGPMLLDFLRDDARLDIEEFVQKLNPRYQQHFLHKTAASCEVAQPELESRVKSDKIVTANGPVLDEMRRVRLLTTINYHH